MRAVKLCLFGAATDTTNMGVSALCYSTLAGIARRELDADITVFDNGRGARPASLRVGDRDFEYRLRGGNNSRRYYRRESYWNMRVSGWLRGLGNPGTTAFLDSDAILDVSGGDSFCDLYGAKVFASNVMMKHMALAHRVPLVLMPQTYGPFQDPQCRTVAQEIIQKATMAWARDDRSFEVLQGLLGSKFDPARHMCSVDLAFGLEARQPDIPTWLVNALNSPRRPVGLNISGLIYNDPGNARLRYGFRADYRDVVNRLLVRLLRETDRSVILVPHVLCEPPAVESDSAACDAVIQSLNGEYSDRVFLLPSNYDPSEIKWVISQTEWFCSTRMHSGIAALSSGVPTAAIAYSIKTAGVFESCDQGEHVVDPRSSDIEEVVERLWWSWENRASAKLSLSARLPRVLAKVEQQMDKLVATLRGLREARS